MAEWEKYKERNLNIRKLRKQGFSIKKIAKELKCSAFNVRWYTKDIELTKKQKEKLKNNSKIGLKAANLVCKARWDKYKKDAEDTARDEWNKIKRDPELLALVAFYWSEGSKRGHKDFTITNSDPGVMFACKKAIEKITNNKIFLNVSIYAGQNKTKSVFAWEKAIGIKPSIYIKNKRTKGRLYSKYGVARLRIKKSTTLY